MNRWVKRVIHVTSTLPLAGILCLVVGCSNFDKNWRAAGEKSVAPNMEGRWEGTWSSSAGHGGGKLRCLMRKTEEGYEAQYRATYWGIFNAEYTVIMRTLERDGKLLLTGQHDLGLLAGGKYEFAGEMSGEQFVANYRSAFDAGEFRLLRSHESEP